MDRILPRIEHVVVLMLENRSLDNLLGWLYADQENRPVHNVPMPPKDGKAYYDGLVEGKFSNPDQHGVEHPVVVVQGTRLCVLHDSAPKTRQLVTMSIPVRVIGYSSCKALRFGQLDGTGRPVFPYDV